MNINQLTVAIGYGASIALFVAAAFYMVLFALSFIPSKDEQAEHVRRLVIHIFVLACVSYSFFGLFNIYVLQLHFPQIVTVFPDWIFILGKFSAPISLFCFTVMFTKSTPVKSLAAFAFWQHQKKYFNMLYVLDVAFVILLLLCSFHTQVVAAASLALFVPHCFAGVVFSFYGLSNIPLSKFYGWLFLLVALVMLCLSGLVWYYELAQLPVSLLLSVHLFLGFMVLMLSFVVARFNQDESKRFVDVSKVKMQDFFANIYAALKQNEFHVVYQPKLDLKTNQPSGMEALLRWEHTKKGNIPPGDFIPAAEQTEIINNICEWTIRQVVKDTKALWNAGIELPVAINFSIKNLYPAMVEVLHTSMKQHKLPARAITIEITESLFFHSSALQSQALDMISDYGMQLSLDDYGAGFSSLSHLEQLGIDEIKIDKSFIINMEKSEKNRVIVNSTIQMGHALGMSVVAEGVEDERIQAQLKALDCDKVQGFGIAKPMPLDKMIEWVNGYKQPTKTL